MPFKLADAIVYFRGDKTQLQKDLGAAEGMVKQGGASSGRGFGTAFSVALGGLIQQGIQKVVGGIVNLGKNALLTAGRAEEMRIVAEAIGNTMGHTTEAINAEIDRVKALGITTTVAAKAVSQFARYQLELAKTTDLAAVAQNAAVIAGEDSSETLDGLIYGITSLNTRVLRTRGILFDGQEALNAYAASIGKTAGELTLAEKQQAFLNATIEAGAPLVGLYDKAMQTFSKQLRSLPRNFAELGEAFGQHFTRPAGQAVQIFRQFLSALAGTANEGGALYPVLQKLGAGLSVVMDALSGVGQKAGEAAGGLLARLGAAMIDTSRRAMQWGVDFAVNYGDGIIRGAISAITAAMNFISGLLSSWLAPGSPPAVAPRLVEWGMEAMAEWLHGFTQADFSVLQSAQSSLQQALQNLVASGELDESAASDLFVNLSQGLMEALASGEGLEEILAQIEAEAGEYGKEIRELIELQVAQAEAAEAVQAAEEALDVAREKSDAANERLERLEDEYDWMLKTGATTEDLLAKQREVEAARAEATAAEDELNAAEEQLEAAEEQEAALAEQIQLQEQLVQQLLQMGQEMSNLGDSLEEAFGGGGLGRALEDEVSGALSNIAEMEMPVPVIPTEELVSPFDEAKNQIKAALDEMFAPLREKIEEWGQLLEPLKSKWDEFTGLIKQAWDEKVKEPLSQWWNEWGPKVETALGNIWMVITTVFDQIMGFVTEHGDSIQTILGGAWQALSLPLKLAWDTLRGIFETFLAILSGDWEGAWNSLRDMAGRLWDDIVGVLSGVWDVIKGVATIVWSEIKGVIEGPVNAIKSAWEGLIAKGQSVVEWIQNSQLYQLFEAIGRVLSEVVGVAVTALAGFWQNVLLPALQEVWGFITEHLQPVWEGLQEFFDNVFSGSAEGVVTVMDKIKGVFDDVKAAIEDALGPAFTWLKDHVLTPVEGAFDAIRIVVEKIIEWLNSLADTISNITLPDWLTPGSPTPFEMGLRGIADTVKDLASMKLPLLAAEMEGLGGGNPSAGQADSRSYTTNSTINIQSHRPPSADEILAVQRNHVMRRRAWRGG